MAEDSSEGGGTKLRGMVRTASIGDGVLLRLGYKWPCYGGYGLVVEASNWRAS